MMTRPPTEPASDAALVDAWRAGSEQAATALVARHATSIARFLAASGAGASDIEDLVQDTFFRAFRRIDSWRGEAAFRSWLFTIAGNLLKDEYRRSRGRTVVTLEDRDVAGHDDPAATLTARETETRLQDGLTRLPRLQREVFLLRVQQGIEYQEIARILGTTAGAARVHYHHAVRRLKELVQ
jgi:RNA polymerase sigma-70 factor (ECF subfamily)